MSYTTIAECSRDAAFFDRVSACCAQEGHSVALDATSLWRFAAAADIEQAYASALAAGNSNPGGDESVITTA